MGRARVIIADTDFDYIVPLQLKFVETFFDQIDLEIISDRGYFQSLFSTPQTVDVLIVSESLYDGSLRLHTIGSIFLMTEQRDDGATSELNICRLYKYTSVREIFTEITGRCADVLQTVTGHKVAPRIVLVYSACGGTGKTTVAMGIAAGLARHNKKALYLNADHLQSFQYLMDDQTPLPGDVSGSLSRRDRDAYRIVANWIRKERFFYLPPFKAALMSLGLDYGVYERIAVAARDSGDYDYVIVDADMTFHEEKARLLGVADKVVVVTDQSYAAVYATNRLVANISGVNTEKYIFVCNAFRKDQENFLTSQEMDVKFNVNEYIEYFTRFSWMSWEELARQRDMQKIAMLVM